MAIFGLSSRTVALIGFGLFLAFYLDDSPPVLSRELSQWINKGQYVIHEGFKIFYKEKRVEGSDGPVLICLHGFPTFSFDWSKLIPNLQSTFGRIIAPDFIGYGFSDKPIRRAYSIFEQADIIESMAEKLGISQAHIIAHDYGDTVAQELLARYEHRISPGKQGFQILSVTLLNGGIFPETNWPRLGQKLLLVPYLNQLLVKLMNIYTFQRGLNEVFGPDTQLDADEAGDYWAAVVNNNGHVVLPRLLSYIDERKANRERWVGVLQITTVPVHCIYGPADPVNPTPQFPDRFKELVGASKLTVLSPSVGHYPQLEAPRETAEAFIHFLRDAFGNTVTLANNTVPA